MKRECPNCGKKIDWKEQILDWIKNYGEDWMEFAMLSIFCYNCDNYAGEIDFMEGKVKTKKVKSKALKGKEVLVPTSHPKKGNKHGKRQK